MRRFPAKSVGHHHPSRQVCYDEISQSGYEDRLQSLCEVMLSYLLSFCVFLMIFFLSLAFALGSCVGASLCCLYEKSAAVTFMLAPSPSLGLGELQKHAVGEFRQTLVASHQASVQPD